MGGGLNKASGVESGKQCNYVGDKEKKCAEGKRREKKADVKLVGGWSRHEPNQQREWSMSTKRQTSVQKRGGKQRTYGGKRASETLRVVTRVTR